MNCLTREMSYGTCFAYILEEGNNFSLIEYKVLQSQEDFFVKCTKILYNGKTQLFYLPEFYKPLSDLFTQLEIDDFMTATVNLLAAILTVKNNGFLKMERLEAEIHKIFIDPVSYKIHMVYCPFDRDIYQNECRFQNKIKDLLLKIIADSKWVLFPEALKLSGLLKDETTDFQILYDLLRKEKGILYPPRDIERKGEPVNKPRLILFSAEIPLEILITKDEFVLGKKESAVDVVLSFNKLISRVHCKITRQGDQYYITDLQSLNGTYINNSQRLQAYKPYLIHNDDKIYLANSMFQVRID